MKNPRPSILVGLTIFVLSFTFGLFIGRNYGGHSITVCVPEEFKLPPPAPAQESIDSSSDIPNASFPIDINSASVTQLTALPGIGDGLAEQIVTYRESNGAFSHAEELLNVPGIGENRLEAILSFITVGGA